MFGGLSGSTIVALRGSASLHAVFMCVSCVAYSQSRQFHLYLPARVGNGWPRADSLLYSFQRGSSLVPPSLPLPSNMFSNGQVEVSVGDLCSVVITIVCGFISDFVSCFISSDPHMAGDFTEGHLLIFLDQTYQFSLYFLHYRMFWVALFKGLQGRFGVGEDGPCLFLCYSYICQCTFYGHEFSCVYGCLRREGLSPYSVVVVATHNTKASSRISLGPIGVDMLTVGMYMHMGQECLSCLHFSRLPLYSLYSKTAHI